MATRTPARGPGAVRAGSAARSELPHVVHVGRIRPVPHWSMPRHVHHDVHQLIVVLAGQIETQIRGIPVAGGPGAVLLYPRGEAHAEAAVGPVPLETIFIGWRWAGRRDILRWPLCADDVRGRIRALAGWLEDTPGLPPAHPRAADALLLALLDEYRRAGSGGESPLVRQVRQYIHEHLSEAIALDDLAEAACLSRFHFARRFAAATGRPPMRYLAECRVAAARTHLLAGPAPLRHVARVVGFADEFQLSRVFKRITGVSPGALRRGRR